jgi:hypothetical protein
MAAALVARLGVVALGLLLWFWTQAMIARRRAPVGRVGDRVHDLTARWNAYLHQHPRKANTVLIASTAMIDLLGLYLIGATVLGPSLRPFLGLFILFALRQVCQGLIALPEPPGMIWRSPGFPAVFVTYGTANDLFFSGHTAIAVYAACELVRTGPAWLGFIGVLVAVLEAITVLVLRAHYTMDVFAATLAAFFAVAAAAWIAPGCDRLVLDLVSRVGG